MAGPNSTIESMSVPVTLALVMKAYVWPIAVAGMTAEIIDPCMDGVTLVIARPLTKVTK